MKDQDFDKFFSDKFRDSEVDPPAGSWENIAAALDDQEAGKPVRKFPWIILSLAATLLLTLGIGLKLTLLKEDVKQPIAHVASESAATPPPAVEQVRTEAGQAALENTPKTAEEPRATKVVLAYAQPQLMEESEEEQESVAVGHNDAPVELAYVQPNNRINPSEMEEQLVNSVDDIALQPRSEAPVATIQQETAGEIPHQESGRRNKQGLFVRVLNNIADNISILNKDVQFSQDEEGTLRIDLTNSLAKTRN